MKSLKIFWDSWEKSLGGDILITAKVIREDHGLFLWNRHGRDFVKYWHTWDIYNTEKGKHVRTVSSLNDIIKSAKQFIETGEFYNANSFNDSASHDTAVEAQDFLDAVDCLGKEKVAELIKRLKNPTSPIRHIGRVV